MTVAMEKKPTRHEISTAVTDLGWRYVLAHLVTFVPVTSLADAARVAASVAEVSATAHMALCPDRVILSLQSPHTGTVTAHEIETAQRIAELGLTLDPGVGEHSVQVLEIAIDAMDIPSVRPFWRAVFGYADEPTHSDPGAALIDPTGQGPAIWFQQMSEPRPQRNRIHFDISVPHDEAQRRIAATLAAGGTLVDDKEAPAFWVLADPEGNEACITTWQGRD
jgi:4a-hydroxytetrahydrobiopterin dehydratase